MGRTTPTVSFLTPICNPDYLRWSSDETGARLLDVLAREDAADLAAEEDERQDRDDGDQREDEGVLGQTLTFIPAGERYSSLR
jgi:hypothetical protein